MLPFALQFFADLGYASDKTEEFPPTPDGFAAAFHHTLTKNALSDEWQSVHLLFQLTGEDVGGQLTLGGDEFDRTRFASFLFFAVDLKGDSYNRSQLAGIARELNKPFPMPVIVLMRHGQTLSLASLHRRPRKDDDNRDVLERVVLLKDIEINTKQRHRAHVEILRELSEARRNASDWQSFFAEWNRVLDISELNRRFYRDYKEVFESVEKQVRGIESTEGVRDWTQRLFNRLLFLRFLEKKGWLEFDGSHDYLRALWEAPRAEKETFLGNRLFWTFFRGLNTANEDGSIHSMPALIERRGHVPFLNGGLFDLQDELDGQGVVTFANENLVFTSILGLFERYVFTVDENTPLEEEVGVDPEMLGKVFEELTNERTESGSYYTPRVVVAFMAREALKGYLSSCAPKRAIERFVEEGDASGITAPEKVLKALKEVRICDPACGSGAYLLGAMQELLRLRESLFAAHAVDPLEQYDRKLEIIERNLYGADLMGFAVNIAMLRLWLSLVVEYNGDVKDLPALPNLQYKIGQGDSLTAPNPNAFDLQRDSYRKLAGELADLQREWFEESYRRSKGEITRTKREIVADIAAKNAEIQKELGDVAPADSHDWRLKFAEVFAHDGFDIVIANPPYGARVADATRDSYFARSRGESQSKDTYGLFMARGLQLLKPGGWFTFIVSDTWRTIKSHKPLRRRLLEQTSVAHLLDLPAWIFGATVNTGILTFQKAAPAESHGLIAADLRGLSNGDWNALGAQLRAVAGEGDDRQTLQIARYSYPQSTIGTYDNASFFIAAPALYALMSDPKFRPLGEVAEVKHGLTTGDTRTYVYKSAGARGTYAIAESNLIFDLAQAGTLSQEEKKHGFDEKKFGGRFLVPYDKGGAADIADGWLPQFLVPTEYFIDWRKSSVDAMKKLKGFRHDGKDYFFQDGLTFSHTGVYSPTFRKGCGGLFDTAGSCLFPNNIPVDVMLGF